MERRFALIDENGSGQIDGTELREAIESLYGKDVEDAVVADMMRAADTDGDGEVGVPSRSPPHVRRFERDVVGPQDLLPGRHHLSARVAVEPPRGRLREQDALRVARA